MQYLTSCYEQEVKPYLESDLEKATKGMKAFVREMRENEGEIGTQVNKGNCFMASANHLLGSLIDRCGVGTASEQFENWADKARQPKEEAD